MKTHTMNIIKSVAAALVFSGALSAATVENFNGYTINAPLSSNPGWTESEPSSPGSPLSWVGSLNGSPAGAIGGFYDAPTGSSYSVSLASSHSLANAVVSVSIAFTDYTDYAFRDQFSFSVLNAGGTALASVYFTPLEASSPGADAYGWNVSYALAGGQTIDTALKLYAGNLYDVSLGFGAGSFSVNIGNSINTYSFSTGAVTYDVGNDSIGGVSFGFSKLPGNSDFGDGFMSFDNIGMATSSAIPEPSAAAMLMALVAGCVVTIRRRNLRD